ncbi:MAG: hypothetical protein AAFP20_04110 [Cyanobacteria bacterium J06614_10]
MNKKILAGVGVGSVLALFFGGKAVVSHVAAKELDKAIEEVSAFVDVDYQKVDVSLLGRGTTVKNMVITPVASGVPITVDEMTLYDYKDKNEVPTYLNLAVKGISLSPEALGDNAELFSELGYEKDLSANFATEYEYKEGEKTVRLKQLRLGADDVGNVEMNFRFSNVSLDQNAIASLPLSLFGMEFHEAKITYKDDSFMERLFETTAAAEGISVEEAKSAAIQGLEQELEAGNSPLPDTFVSEMKDFINDPDSFSLTFSPSDPVPFSSFASVGGPEEMIELLNVKFES